MSLLVTPVTLVGNPVAPVSGLGTLSPVLLCEG